MNASEKSPKGKLLRLKEGYNPNSSSVGSIVFAFPAALYTLPALFGSVSAIILATKLQTNKDPKNPKEKE